MRAVVRVVLPVLVLAAVSCQSGADDEIAPRQTEEIEMQEWSLVVESSGGITGMGDGSVSIESSGLIEKTDPNGRGCRATIEGERLDDLWSAVEAARPGSWNGQYLQQGGADFFAYTLRLNVDGVEHGPVEWNDGVEMPPDLQRLTDTVNTIRRSIDCNEQRRPTSTS